MVHLYTRWNRTIAWTSSLSLQLTLSAEAVLIVMLIVLIAETVTTLSRGQLTLPLLIVFLLVFFDCPVDALVQLSYCFFPIYKITCNSGLVTCITILAYFSTNISYVFNLQSITDGYDLHPLLQRFVVHLFLMSQNNNMTFQTYIEVKVLNKKIL
jgi:hypothetical protein